MKDEILRKTIEYCVLICFLFSSIIFSQNLDFIPTNFSGNMTSTGNSGVAIVSGVNSIFLNPAGINLLNGTEILFSIKGEYYSYRLLNYLHNKDLGRIFSDGKFKPVYPNILIKTNVNKKIGVGIGYINYLSPFLINSKRAITWSTLYNQETKGSIKGIIFGLGYNYNSNLSGGINISKYNGRITSEIQGDNHGTNKGKQLELITNLTGWNIKIGSQLYLNRGSFGFVVSSPIKFISNITTELSRDSLYKNLIPENNKSSISVPFNFTFGCTFDYSDNITIMFDLLTYFVNKSDLGLNIFEYGGDPSWKNNVGINTGFVYLSDKNLNYPIKFGYSFQPQIYSSINSFEEENHAIKIEYKKQNIKHSFSFGSSFKHQNTIIDYGIKYSFLKWNRDYKTVSYLTEDNYLERQYMFFMNFVIQILK